MCGIAGYFLKKTDKHPVAVMERMLAPIRVRGPDDEGACLISRSEKKYQLYQTPKTTPVIAARLQPLRPGGDVVAHDAAFLHTRYAIIDLSEGGHQPFVSRDGSVVAVFNGEIYNYIELRQELSALGAQFKTSSDTEVLVEGYCLLKEKLWARLNGFWAVALYDFRDGRVTLSRDRIGVAPLYYRQTEEGFYFASMIQPLIDIAPAGVTRDDDVVRGFIQYGMKDYDETTYYSQIKSIPSKTSVVFEPGQYTSVQAKRQKYWDFPPLRLTVNDISFEQAVKQYRETFFSAVELRLRADVKVAFELSGGLDSSSVVAAAAILRKNNVTTYTADVKGADEVRYARSVIQRYPIDYHILENLEDDLVAGYKDFAKVMEEPFDNPNAYTHHRMLRIMKSDGVNVVVTGAGGDEVLAGYESSYWPAAYRELRRGGRCSYLHADWYEFCRRFKTWKTARATLRHYGADSLQRILRVKKKDSPFTGRLSLATKAAAHARQYETMSFHQRALFHFNVALVPFYMRSSDHFTMGIPVEHRFPLLDYRMVELGLRLPIQYLFHGGWTKYILRKAMEPYLPKKILWRRKKSGFFFPYGDYLKDKKDVYAPMLNQLRRIDFPVDELGPYDQLCRIDPVMLWRMVSTAMWVELNGSSRPLSLD
jgi:asparagine synthase (glutamine-hydrolysing)